MKFPEISSCIGQGLECFLYGKPLKPPKETDLYPLTERLAFLLNNVERVSVDHVLEIGYTRGYSILSPYFGLKMLDNQPDQQRRMLEGIVKAYIEGEGHDGATRAVESILRPDGEVNADLSFHPVSPKKLSRVATWGPPAVDRRAHEVLTETRGNGERPVIIGYGGLLALQASIETADTTTGEGRILIVFPGKIETENFGYTITRFAMRAVVNKLTQADLETGAPVALIDDATHLGKTYSQLKSFFPNAHIREAPLYKPLNLLT